MARFHYSLSGAEPILRDLRVYNGGSAMYKGQVVAYGPVATAENCGCVISADADVLSNIVGVLNEDIAAANLSVVATGVDYYGKVIINPDVAWLCQYSTAAADDVPTTAADSTGKSLTVTQVADHERAWAYNKTNGNLFQVGATTGTTVLTAATDYDDNLAATGSGDLIIVMPAPYSADVAGGSVDLATNCIDVAGYNADAGAGAALIMENYIESQYRPMEPLVCAKHSGFSYAAEDPKFYADVYFTEHLLLTGGAVNDRVIT